MLLITYVVQHSCRYGCARAEDLDVALSALHFTQLVLAHMVIVMVHFAARCKI